MVCAYVLCARLILFEPFIEEVVGVLSEIWGIYLRSSGGRFAWNNNSRLSPPIRAVTWQKEVLINSIPPISQEPYDKVLNET